MERSDRRGQTGNVRLERSDQIGVVYEIRLASRIGEVSSERSDQRSAVCEISSAGRKNLLYLLRSLETNSIFESEDCLIAWLVVALLF